MFYRQIFDTKSTLFLFLSLKCFIASVLAWIAVFTLLLLECWLLDWWFAGWDISIWRLFLFYDNTHKIGRSSIDLFFSFASLYIVFIFFVVNRRWLCTSSRLKSYRGFTCFYVALYASLKIYSDSFFSLIGTIPCLYLEKNGNLCSCRSIIYLMKPFELFTASSSSIALLLIMNDLFLKFIVLFFSSYWLFRIRIVCQFVIVDLP